jgi:threonine dehydrogenase-like Zn-dependent dehydrogenase
MPLGLYVDKPENITLRDVPQLSLSSRQVRIRPTLAAIKHGTTFHLFSGMTPFNNHSFDKSLRLFVDPAEPLPHRNLVGTFVGNMVVGSIVEIGSEVRKFKTGDRVYCHAAACEMVTLNESEVHYAVSSMSDSDALCLDPALFAYAAVRDARICIGDNVAVFGLGAIGLFIVQLLRRCGCLNIIAVDPLEVRRRLAEKFGATLTLDPNRNNVGLKSREVLGAGADIAIEASGSYASLNDAFRTVRQCGRIVTLGYYRGNAGDLNLAAEWLHNRLEMICSLPDWNNPSREFPAWDRNRMWSTLVEFFSRNMLTSEGILDPIVSLNDAPRTFMQIYASPGQSVKMGIRFREL